MRKGLILVVALLCMASMMAAMAYTSAAVSNNAKLSVVPTDDALLAIVENPAFTDFAKIGENGKMTIDFTGGVSNSGFQPGSSYFFNDLFFIKNNLTDTSIKVGLRFDCVYPGDTWMRGLHTVSSDREVPEWTGKEYPKALMHGYGNRFVSGWNEKRYVILGPGESVGIDWNFKGVDGGFGDESYTLQVHAEAIREVVE